MRSESIEGVMNERNLRATISSQAIVKVGKRVTIEFYGEKSNRSARML